MDALIDARAIVENAGYRAPSCLLTDTAGLKALNELEREFPVFRAVLDAANINSRYRVGSI